MVDSQNTISLQEIIDKGKRIVFFGGAGVSTESVAKTRQINNDINN